MAKRDAHGEICVLLQEKQDYYRGYLESTERMKTCLETGDMVRFGKNLTKRRSFIHKIEGLDKTINTLINVGIKNVQDPPGELKGHMNRYLQGMKEIMSTIQLMDQELIETIGEDTERLKEDLLKGRRARRAAQGYRQASLCRPRFMDITAR